MTYKPEIDGLRALAVLLVLFCHMQLGIPGGFVGVDVFFVISGFLITSIIYTGLLKKQFSFPIFYGKRFVRLYPALIVIIGLTYIAGLFLTDPIFFENLARTARYALTSTSNLFFNTHLNYFALDAQRQPFLHTWSLGVEWQFYLIWPLIMWGMMKISQRKWVYILLLLLISAASVYGSQWALTHEPRAAYYQMYFRAFELAIGGLVFFIYDKKPSLLISILLVIAGTIAILYAAFTLTGFSAFPGYIALIPCLGAAACIYGGQGFIKGNLLRLPWFVFIGKISYSVYLVHWPLLVLYKYYIYRDLFFSEKIVLFLLSLALGALLYSLVEKRINWKNLRSKLKGCLIMIAICLAMMVVFLYTSRMSSGMPWRVADSDYYNQQYLTWGGKSFPEKTVLGNKAGLPLALMAGDSFAGSMTFGIDQAFQDSDYSIPSIYHSGCMFSEIDETASIVQSCKDATRLMIDEVNAQNLPLILVQSWGTTVTLDQRNIASLSVYRTPETFKEFLTNNLDDIHTKIDGKPMFLVASVPFRKWGESDLECMLRPNFARQACLAQIEPYDYRQTPIIEYNDFLKEYANTHDNVYYIEVGPTACPDNVCTPERNAKLYNDGFHTSLYGSKEVGAYVAAEIQRILQKP